MHSTVLPNGPHGLTLYIPAAARNALCLRAGMRATWEISPSGRSATLSFHSANRSANIPAAPEES